VGEEEAKDKSFGHSELIEQLLLDEIMGDDLTKEKEDLES